MSTEKMTAVPRWRCWMERLASKTLLHVTLPAIMIYIVIGTLAQKTMGLYEATHRFFLAPFVYVYGVPVPGMPVFMAVLTVNLLAHLLLYGRWTAARAGTLLTHLGVILLLLGAWMTCLWAQEGYMDIREGKTADYVSDYHQRELVVRNLTQKTAYILPFDALLSQEGTSHHIAEGVTITIREICMNCALSRRQDVDAATFGMARGMQLSAKPPARNNEENMAGISFVVEGSQQDGLYTALENVAVIPTFKVRGEEFSVAVEKQRRALPFSVELLRTSRTLYPGSQEAKGYDSRVRIHDGEGAWEASISMNQPVRYKGYALFQSSYIEDEGGRRSVIAVVYNPIRTFPYMAAAIMVIGMLWHIRFRPRGRGAMLVLLAALAQGGVAPSDAQAAQPEIAYDLRHFSKLPVADDGRIKPIDSVARERMEFIGGTRSKAVESFFTILFLPEQAESLPMIRVAGSGARNALELAPQPGHRYAADVLEKALEKHKEAMQGVLDAPDAGITEEQRQLRDAYARYRAYRDISHAFDAYRTLEAVEVSALPKPLQERLKDAVPLTFEASASLQSIIEQQTRELVKRKGADVARYTPQEQALAHLSYVLTLMRAVGERAAPLAVVHNTGFTQFASPWAIVLEGAGGPGFAASLGQWKTLVAQVSDVARWNETVGAMYREFPAPLGFRLEWASNHVQLLGLALAGYAAVTLALLAMYVVQRLYLRPLLGGLGVAVGLHLAAMLVRVGILARPPVGTLYESILFAGLVLAGVCWWRAMRTRQPVWIAQSSVGGLLLLLLAMANDLTPGDNKTMLTAVLNTNFWLTTHVLTVTVGYAFSLLTALLAHVMLFTRVLDDDAYARLKRAALVALLFMAAGTMLGGIWADQSWGRFWGWDPKENGALLIVLWLVWFLHGEVTRSMTRRWVVIGFALLAVMVALSWFGVNLLNIGLHSYGFTQGVQWGLGLFVGLELLLVAVCGRRIGQGMEKK